ncbi:hypothetical protein Mal4_47850 [Maioricimonas rarisocia]|uniref:Uncharacterized protein n=1 Tax=Maioricimonas rarisocia TaxID=2528026 RepID=A0A517ZD93_9PLAN|nr:hypothetical protein [Maioricimonas rarisocia]QDU40429.1 hypothetical protein Mal4_47850 [Maioricimonas rarisocia]
MTAFVAGLPAAVMAQSDVAAPVAEDVEQDAAAADDDDRTSEVAIGLLAVVGVALLGLVMLAVAILGGNRVRRLARQTGRRGEAPMDGGDETGIPIEGDELPPERPIHPEQNGKPTQPDHP